MVRTFVMGDPQASFAKTMEVLQLHHALDGDRLADDVVLVSIGDHFDYDVKDPDTAGREGLAMLRWLASHPREQVAMLLGNHDASRVMELATISDAEFGRARQLARAIDEVEHRRGDPSEAIAAFSHEFPTLPAPGVVGRDYASFSSEQRTLVVELLLSGRFRLGLTGELSDGRAVLLTHAGITQRELALLGNPTCTPDAIAEALALFLANALARVRMDWERGMITPLSLEPLHVTGGAGEEGGGMLYHRPSNPDRAGANRGWEHAATRPRRFDPHTLPAGLTQVVGHSGHNKCVQELDGWVTPSARARKHGGIRTLRVHGDQVTYDLGVAPPAPGAADVVLVDGELRRVPAAEVALLPLARLT